MYFVGLDADIY